MLCWFEGGITDSFGGYRPLRDGLGLLRGTACPHYDGAAAPISIQAVRGRRSTTWLCRRRRCRLHFVGSRLKQAVSSCPKALAYRVQLKRGQVEEAAIPVRYLGKRDSNKAA